MRIFLPPSLKMSPMLPLKKIKINCPCPRLLDPLILEFLIFNLIEVILLNFCEKNKIVGISSQTIKNELQIKHFNLNDSLQFVRNLDFVTST